MIRKSTESEILETERLVLSTRDDIQALLDDGKRVHVIWDFDGVLMDSRSDDVFQISGYDLETYFAHEHRLLLDVPGQGPWLLPIAHTGGAEPHFPPDRFTQDIVTARSSTISMRVHIFCLQWKLRTRWMLFLGHQTKVNSYRMILDSLRNDADVHVFCVDDKEDHVTAFLEAAEEAEMENRAHGIVSPVLRTYSEEELRTYLDKVTGADGDSPVRVRNPSNDVDGFIVLPGGLDQFRGYMSQLVSEKVSDGHNTELRNAFVKVFGEPGEGRFETEEELQEAIRSFILDLNCP